MIPTDKEGKWTLVDALPAPINCSEAATKVCYTPAEWGVDSMDAAVTEQLMNAGALK